MIHVTEGAVARLRDLLAERSATGQGLRVEVAKGGCSGLQYQISLGPRRTGDTVIQRGDTEFFVDSASAPYLRDATLDFAEGLTGAGFRIVNPHAARTCGCGASFEPTER